jgi:hypothetical protein
LTSIPTPSARLAATKAAISLARHEVGDDVLAIDSPARADPAQPGRANQREALGDHPRRAVIVAKHFDPFGGEAGLFLELAPRRGLDIVGLAIVPDQPRGKLQAAPPDRHPRLLDEQYLAVMLGEDHHRADPPRALDIFPPPAFDRGEELALPHHFAR